MMDYNGIEQRPDQGRDCSELFNEIVEIILQLSVRVKEARANRSLGNSKDFTDVGVLKTLNIIESHHGAVILRQLLHGFVQPFLKFMEINVS